MPARAVINLLKRQFNEAKVVSPNNNSHGGLSKGTWIAIIIIAVIGILLPMCSLFFVRRFFKNRRAEQWLDEEGGASAASSVRRGSIAYATDIEAWRRKDVSADAQKTKPVLGIKRFSDQSTMTEKDGAWHLSQTQSVSPGGPTPIYSVCSSPHVMSPTLPSIVAPPSEAKENRHRSAPAAGKMTRKTPPSPSPACAEGSPSLRASGSSPSRSAAGSSGSSSGRRGSGHGGGHANASSSGHSKRASSRSSRGGVKTPPASPTPPPMARGWPALLIQAGARPMDEPDPSKRSSRKARSNHSH